MSLQKVLERIWWTDFPAGRQPPALYLLRPPAALYRALVLWRGRFYDRGILKTHRLPCPVLSVGNLTVGGTGKTPTVINLAGLLVRAGRRPAILSRGYGGRSRATVNIVSDGRTVRMRPREAGDEPILLARNLPGVPVLTGPHRLLTGRVALERLGADSLILDDAFQHRGLARDVDIVLLDRRKPLGNGRTLPAGPLREPVSALRRAGCLIATGEGGEDARLEAPPWPMILQRLPGPLPVFAGKRRPRDLIRPLSGEILPLDSLRGKRICAFAGIARPEAFRQSLTALGGEVAAFTPFPDHHVYTGPDRDAIDGAAGKAGAELIVTTEKDAVKLASSFAFAGRLLALRIVMEIDGGPVDFARFILDAVTSWKKPEPRP